MQHPAPDGSTQETPLISVAFHTPQDSTETDKSGGAIFVDRDGVLNRFGHMKSAKDVDRFMEPGAVESLVRLAELVVANGGKFTTVPSTAVNGFKPEGGMLLEAASQHGLDLSKSYMVATRSRICWPPKVPTQKCALCGSKPAKVAVTTSSPTNPKPGTTTSNTAADWIISQESNPT